jgi:hypothetical protein
MKLRLWSFVVLVMIGAVVAGYCSGRYQGVRSTRIETQQFLREFASATDLDAYLQQRGQKEWSGKLAIYGIGGPSSYIHSKGASSYAILAGIASVAAGVIGLVVLSRRQHERPVA